MKKYTLILTGFLLFSSVIKSQVINSPAWVMNINTSPDSAQLFPVKTLTDVSGNVLVLSTYYKNQSGSIINKIHLNKFDTDGNLIWNLSFDNNGNGQPRPYDCALDNSGNIYIAGAFMELPQYRPLLLKIGTAGTVVWMSDSTNSFSTGMYRQILFRDDLLYLRHEAGVAVFNVNGDEVWSLPVLSSVIAVDNSGRMLVSDFASGSQQLAVYHTNGSQDTSFNIINAERIAVDNQNNIYLLAQWPGYELAKFYSDYVFQWSTDSFPPNLSFGDFGFDVLTDYNNDVIVVGITDTMYKFSPEGMQVWKKSMNGLDSYLTDAKIVYTNFLSVAGTFSNSIDYEVKVALFDINGNISWQGIYNSTIQQEFAVSCAIDNSGIYLLEDSAGSSTIMKFVSPVFSQPVDYSLVCVDSVWYEPGNNSLINVRVFNGNVSHMNYPSVRIADAGGDTIGNPLNVVNFFAHLGNIFLVYQDSITTAGITDFSMYQFLIQEGFGDTTAVINRCSTLGIEPVGSESLVIYPNPANDKLNILTNMNAGNTDVKIFSETGRLCLQENFSSGRIITVDISSLPPGFFILRVGIDGEFRNVRFIKME